MSKHYDTDENGYPILYGMDEAQYDAEVRKLSIQADCSYRCAMDIFHANVLNRESTDELKTARENEAREARFHIEPAEIENFAWELAEDTAKLKKFSFNQKWAAYAEWLKLLQNVDPGKHDLREFKKSFGNHAERISKIVMEVR